MTDASSDERMILAIGRIERAISRLERLPPAAPAAPPDPALIDRHDRLRATIEAAIARIDRLIDQPED